MFVIKIRNPLEVKILKSIFGFYFNVLEEVSELCFGYVEVDFINKEIKVTSEKVANEIPILFYFNEDYISRFISRNPEESLTHNRKLLF